jgi:hypothetical protein
MLIFREEMLKVAELFGFKSKGKSLSTIIGVDNSIEFCIFSSSVED